MPFITDHELYDQLYHAIRECSVVLGTAKGENHEVFARYSSFISGSASCYNKLIHYGIKDAYRYDIHFQDIPGLGHVFDPKFSDHNNLYHIITRAMMYDEIYNVACTLPNMPKDFLADLKTFGERLEVELPIIMLTRMLNGDTEEAKNTISHPFVMSTMSNALRISQKIMVNALTSLSDKSEDIHERSMYLMIACCRYLERIGVMPTTVEGESSDGDVWYDLDTKRMRDVGAKLTWYDYFVKCDITCTVPFHLPGKR